MKKILVLLLLMVSTNVFAEWTWFDDSAGGVGFYIDYETIKKKGHKVKMWSLLDSKTVKKSSGGKEYLSVVMRQEYNCEEETSRQLDFYLYSGNMKQGEIVYSITNIKDEPISILPGSIDEGLFKIACGKK